jgi:hypothetical protein
MAILWVTPNRDVSRECSRYLEVYGAKSVHIPAQGEQSFRFNVNTDSGRT